MRLTFTIGSCFLAAFFLISVVPPGPWCLPTCQSTSGFLTVVDDNDFSLCSGFTFVREGHSTERLFLLEQAWFPPSPFVSTCLSRAPPSRLSSTL